MSVMTQLGLYTQLSEAELVRLIRGASTTYRRYPIKKKNGGERIIFQPSSSTKLLQYCLLDVTFNDIPSNSAAYAYIKGKKSPLLENARLHLDFPYSVHLDMKDFFPSITPSLFYEKCSDLLCFGEEDWKVFNSICFIREKGKYHLSIGAPISPKLSNMVMFAFDEECKKYSNNCTVKCSYSRYADDIWFSSLDENCCKEFLSFIEEQVLPDQYNNCLMLNTKKTRFYGDGQPRRITGLIVTENSYVKVPRKIKRYVRSLIAKDILTPDENDRLRGYVSYIYDNEPQYINNLIQKYGRKYFDKIG